MKLKYILAAGVVALLAGCDESRFLDTKPQGTLNDDLLSSAEGVELLVTSAYAGLKGPNRDMHWVPMTNWTYGEVRSDNAYKGGGGVNDGDFCTLLETFKIDATWANADEKWFQLYCCLQRCNSALRVMNTLDENTLPVLKSRKAEMKVIRAHFFFELVRLFKQVPYFDENVDIDDYKYIPNNQFTREELLGKIAQEFLDAANDLPDTQSQIGRITKNIAYAYAAKAKLYQAYARLEGYTLMVLIILLICKVQLAFQNPEIRMRSQVSPVNSFVITGQMVAQGAVMSILSWGILTVMGMVIFREQLGKVPEKTLLLLALAGFCLMLVCIAVAEILAILIKKAEIIDMAANFVTLGICFLSGIFVPLELLGEGVKKAAQVTPTYWYAKAVDDIFGLTSFTGEKLRPVFMSLGILLAFAAALLAVAFLLARYRSRGEESY